MSARAIATGTISFGLVSIPVKLYTAASSEGLSFNMLHKKCKGRLKQQLFCPVDNEVVERSDTLRGYEYVKNQYVLFTEEELDALESPKTNSIEITEFVPATSVDWIYILKTYYLGPDKGGDKAYRLLSESMNRMGRIAVARYFARGREQLVVLRPFRGGLALHYVYHASEIRSFDEVDVGATADFKPVENDLADRLIEQLSIPAFQPEKYRDEYVERLKSAVEQKAAGQEISAVPAASTAQIIDLFEALKQSLAGAAAPANGGSATRAEDSASFAQPDPAATAAEPAEAKGPTKPPKKAVPRKTVRGKTATG